MGILATIQSQANVASSKTYVTSQVFEEEDIQQLRKEMAIKNNKYARSIGAFIEEKNCTLEKAKSLAIKCSLNKMKGMKSFTIFCNAGDVDTVLKDHTEAVKVATVNEGLQKANADL